MFKAEDLAYCVPRQDAGVRKIYQLKEFNSQGEKMPPMRQEIYVDVASMTEVPLPDPYS